MVYEDDINEIGERRGAARSWRGMAAAVLVALALVGAYELIGLVQASAAGL